MARTRKVNLGMSNIQRTLFVLVIILFLIGILLTAMGSSFHAVYNEFDIFIESYYFRPVEFFIVVGVLMIATSIVGVVGVVKFSTAITNLFTYSLALLLILEVCTAVLGFAFSPSIYHDIRSNMNTTLKQYKQCYRAERCWHFMQSRLHCCGIDGPCDWAAEGIEGTSTTYICSYKNNTFTVPESCCWDSNCSKVYERGCINVLGNYASDSIVTITCCVSIVLILQVFGVLLSFILARSIRPAKTQMEIQRQKNLQRICEEIEKEHKDKGASPVLYNPSSTDA